jgi:hypothetical protein
MSDRSLERTLGPAGLRGQVPEAGAPRRPGFEDIVDRRRAPRRRLRDRLASLEHTANTNPALRTRSQVDTLMLLCDDDVRQVAIALAGVEEFLSSAAALLASPGLAAEALAAAAADPEVLDRMDSLSDNLVNLRRRMGAIATAMK